MKERRAKEKVFKEKEKARAMSNKCKHKAVALFSPAAADSIPTDTRECPSIEQKNVGANTSFDEELSADSRTSIRLFDVGSLVFTDPETCPGVRGNHGERFVGVVTQIDEQGKVTMRSTQSNRILPLVPENRVRLMAKSMSSDDVYTRGFTSDPESKRNERLKSKIEVRDNTLARKQDKIISLQEHLEKFETIHDDNRGFQTVIGELQREIKALHQSTRELYGQTVTQIDEQGQIAG